MKHILFLLSISLLLLIACQKDVAMRDSVSNQEESVTAAAQNLNKDYNPDVSPSKFTNSTAITNQYYPVEAGKKYIYEGQTSEGLEHVEEQRLNTTKNNFGNYLYRCQF